MIPCPNAPRGPYGTQICNVVRESIKDRSERGESICTRHLQALKERCTVLLRKNGMAREMT